MSKQTNSTLEALLDKGNTEHMNRQTENACMRSLACGVGAAQYAVLINKIVNTTYEIRRTVGGFVDKTGGDTNTTI